MKLISCRGCGTVVDFDRLKKIKPERVDLDFGHPAIGQFIECWGGYKFICPSCKLENTFYDDDD